MKLSGKASLCRACGRVFVTTSQFDKHRTGSFPDRSCLLVESIPGWRLNNYGRWTSNLPRLLRRLDLGGEIASTPYGGKG